MKSSERWFSQRVDQHIHLVRWGTFGRPVLLFPTAGGDAEEVERFGLVDALGPLLADGRIKVYSIDSIAGRTWLEQRGRGEAAARYCSWMQTAFDAAIYHEVLPAIRSDCRSSDIEVIAAGASIGAFNAVASVCRHPDAFGAAVGMSGTYDLESWLEGAMNEDFYFSSPLHFVPRLDGPLLDRLRSRFILMAFGQGRWESPEESWRMARVLGDRGVPNRVDPWGHEWDHDWPTWRRMLPEYLHELTS